MGGGGGGLPSPHTTISAGVHVSMVCNDTLFTNKYHKSDIVKMHFIARVDIHRLRSPTKITYFLHLDIIQPDRSLGTILGIKI